MNIYIRVCVRRKERRRNEIERERNVVTKPTNTHLK